MDFLTNATHMAGRFIPANVSAVAMDWARDNPKQAAAIGVGLVCVAAPGAIVGAGVGALGFGGAGPVAGGAAAAFQSYAGVQAARGVFATLQSAAMGGYGLAVLTTSVQTVGMSGMVLGAWNPFGSKDDSPCEEEYLADLYLKGQTWELGNCVCKADA